MGGFGKRVVLGDDDIAIARGGSQARVVVSGDGSGCGSDAVALEKVGHSLEISEVDIEQYDVVFLAGGWGAAWDLGTSEALGRQVTDAYASGASSGSSRNSGSATS